MSIALVGTIGTAAQTTAGSALTTWAWGTSENRSAGNLLVAFVTVTGSATLPTTPNGWSIGKQVAGTSCSATIYWKLAAGSDSVPTINAITSGLIAGQLAEFSGALAVVDQSGSSTGTTSPNTATAGGSNLATAELILMASADRRSVARATVNTWASNDGTPTLAMNNNSVSSTDHYSAAYIASSSATTAQTSVVTLSITSSITGIANVNVSFPQPAPKTASPFALSVTTALGSPVLGTGLTPSAGAQTLAGATPTVTKTSNVSTSPTAASLTASGSTPTVTAPALSQPSAAALSLGAGTPTVLTPRLAQPGAVALNLSAGTPTVATPRLAQPPAASVVTSGATPAVTAPALSQPTAAAVSLGAGTPAVATPVLAQPTAASMVTNLSTPAVALPLSVNPSALALALAYGTPTVSTPDGVAPGAASLALSGAVPQVVASLLVSPSALALALMGAVPYVGTPSHGGTAHKGPTFVPFAQDAPTPTVNDEEDIALVEGL